MRPFKMVPCCRSQKGRYSFIEWTFQNFKCIFPKINFFNSTNSNAHNSAKNKARDLLLVSFCREFYLVLPPGLNSKPTTWYLFIWTHTYRQTTCSLQLSINFRTVRQYSIFLINVFEHLIILHT